MEDKEKLKVYDRNQRKLIKALIKKSRECKLLEIVCSCYATFLTEEQKKASFIMAEGIAKKVMSNDAA